MRWRRPRAPDSLAEVDRALGVLVGRERRIAFDASVAERAGVDIGPGAVWALARFGSYGVSGTLEMARDLEIPEERIAAVQVELRARGLMADVDGNGGVATAALTPAGVAMADQVLSARREQLRVLLAQQDTDREPEVQALLSKLCIELAGQQP